jgi:hypothetical protein
MECSWWQGGSTFNTIVNQRLLNKLLDVRNFASDVESLLLHEGTRSLSDDLCLLEPSDVDETEDY